MIRIELRTKLDISSQYKTSNSFGYNILIILKMEYIIIAVISVDKKDNISASKMMTGRDSRDLHTVASAHVTCTAGFIPRNLIKLSI